MAAGYISPPPISPPAAPHPAQPEYSLALHPYLREPILYITNLAPHVTDADLAQVFDTCVPFRPNIPRDGSGHPLNGTIEFKQLEKAEKALTTLHGRPITSVTPPAQLYLSAYPPSNPPHVPPAPQAQPRLVKHLPPQFSDSALYDLFRPYGPMASARANQAGFGDETGVVEFYLEDDARAAEAALHCAEVGDANIAVQVYQQRRTSGNPSEFGVNPNATSFVPGGGMVPYGSQYSPPRQYGFANVRQTPPFVHGPGQQVQFAPMHGPGSTSHSGLIDPCNLFCKNLDPDIDSNGLFSHFRRFGQIVSARVMRNDNGQSRGFGFVSFQTPDQAASAMQAMNGIVIGSKQLVVRLHEPKQLRQEKLAHRFGSGSGSSGHIRTRSGSGATSPTLSEGGESYWGRSSPGGPVSPGAHVERARRSSGSYYNAALTGNLNLPMQYDELSSLSPVVRREVLTGELSRRVKDVPGVPIAENEIDSIVDSLLGLSLHQLVDGIQDSAKLAEQVRNAKEVLASAAVAEGQRSTHSPSPATSHDSRLLDPNALNATASAPEHPSTPLSLSASLSTPPRTSSPSGSVAPGASERDRLMAAVAKLEPKNAAEITDLLMSLSKRERALCLFNSEVLKTKVAEANEVLEVVTVENNVSPQTGSQGQSIHSSTVPAAPVTPHSKINSMTSDDSPQTPDLSSRGPSAAASPSSPPTPSQGTSHTLASLARLPATEIVKLASSSSATGLPLAKADPRVIEETNHFIDGLQGKTIQQQKQLLGEKLFRVVKTFGVKSAPKVTIALLDQEDIRALAHLMNSYPSVLREKALQSPLASGGK